MGRRNHSRRRPQARRRTPEERALRTPRALPKPPPVEYTIIPRGRCGRKLRFPVAVADQALRQAQALRRARGQEAHMECRWYPCDRCGDAHLTSRTEHIERPTP